MTASDPSSLPLVEPLPPTLDAVSVFQRLASLPHVLFLDSAMRHPQLGRYSFVAADPVEWIVAAPDEPDPLATLRERIATLPSSRHRGLPPFQGGYAGMLGYELGRSLEVVPPARFDEFQLPVLALGLYDVVIAFDHVLEKAWLISQGIPETDCEARMDRARARMRYFQDLLSDSSPAPALNDDMRQSALSQNELAPQFAIDQHPGLTSNFSPDAYRQAVARTIEYIRAGDVFQVNLSQRLLHPATTSALELYLRLRQRNRAPFAGFFNGGPWQVASASPERFIRLDGGQIETRPIKGTRARVLRPEADLFAGDELIASEKDRAENIMIVDLLRNDLSRCCRPDSVRVTQLCGLEMYQFVQHLVSVVEGTLQPGASALDVIRATFPGGSVTGAPKIRAMQIIAELEPTARGAYCGSLGYIGAGGTMDSNILIRTVSASRGWWQLPVGGGIVSQSNPCNEYDETWHKAIGLLRALHP